MPRILSTKKLQQNHRQYLLNAGLAVVEADFISIRHKSFRADTINANLIFTSTNAFKSFLQNEVSTSLKANNIFCVGIKTREFIEQNGYNVIASADYATELSAILIEGYKNESFTFFSGSMRRDTLPGALTKAGVNFNEIEVYDTILSPHSITTPVDGILFFSPSGVESYLQKNKITNQACFCIGTTTAEAVASSTGKIVLANKPTVENVIIQCINFYKDDIQNKQ